MKKRALFFMLLFFLCFYLSNVFCVGQKVYAVQQTKGIEILGTKFEFLHGNKIFCFSSGFSAGTALFNFNEGKNLQFQEDWYGAIEYFTEATRLNPAYGEAYFKLAECFYALDEYELALTNLDFASKYIKNRSDVENLKGFCFIGLGDLTKAENIFVTVLKSFPNDVDARFGLAELNILKGRVSGAEKEYKQALSRQNTNKKALLSLALVSDELENNEAANNYINQALKYHSGNPEGH